MDILKLILCGLVIALILILLTIQPDEQEETKEITFTEEELRYRDDD